MNSEDSAVVFHDDRYIFGRENGEPYLIADGEKYTLSCHPFEPCLYITGENGSLTAVHNAFDPSVLLDLFGQGKTVTSITGFEYDAQDFCRMVEYAADMGNVGIEAAETVFAGREKKKVSDNIRQADGKVHESNKVFSCSEGISIVKDDPFYDLISLYPDCVTEFCIVDGNHACSGYSAHRCALASACRALFCDGEGATDRSFDVSKAKATKISVGELFAAADKNGRMNYRKAFLYPPHTNSYTSADFDIINRSLFPKGTDELDVYEWTTDWSDYFDDGHEWWGTLCLTVYDKSKERFAVIMASATD